MSVEILGDRVLVRRLDSENKSAGGLVVLTGDSVHTPKGVVLKVGEGRTTKTGVVVPVSVQVDDVVMYLPQAGIKVSLDGEELLVLREDEIYAVVDSTDK
jgi:chaperonin GroES